MTRRLALSLAAAAVLWALAPVAHAEESHALIVYTAFFDRHDSAITADDVAVLGLLARLTGDDPSC